MTLTEPLLPPPKPPDPVHGPYSRVGAAIAWLVILTSVLAVGITNWRASRTESRSEESGDFQLLVSSRVAVGEIRTFGRLNKVPAGLPDQLAQGLKATAVAPAQKLRVVPVLAELKGAAVAMAQLEEWSSQLDTVELRADAATLRSIYHPGGNSSTSRSRAELIRHQGWYGKLAASFGAADTDPVRREVLKKSETAFVGTAVFGLTTFAAIGVGFVLLVVTIVFLSTGKIHRSYRPAPWRSSAFIEAFAIYLGGYVLISLLVRRLLPHTVYLGTIVALVWVPFPMLWPLMRKVSWTELRGAFGWYAARGLLREAGAGVTGYVAGLPVVAAAALITALLSKRFGENTSHPIMFADTSGVLHVIELYLLVSVWAPLVEETMFRGAFFNHLRQWNGWLLSAVASSFIFAALHPQGWAAIPVLGSIGFVLAGIREWRGSFVANVTAHAMNNAFVTTLLIFVLR